MTTHGKFQGASPSAGALPPVPAPLTPRQEVRRILEALVDPDPCALDHNGRCQAHGAGAVDGACGNAAAWKWLDEDRPHTRQGTLEEFGIHASGRSWEGTVARTVDVRDAPFRRSRDGRYAYLPRRAVLRYSATAQGAWECVGVTLHGPVRRQRDGVLGTREVREVWDAEEVRSGLWLPEWVTRLVAEQAPGRL